KDRTATRSVTAASTRTCGHERVRARLADFGRSTRRCASLPNRARLLIAGSATATFNSDDAPSRGRCARNRRTPVSRSPESAASLVLLLLEAHKRGGRGRRLLTVEERQAGRHQGARLLGQRDEALNVRDVVGVTVEDDEGEGKKRQQGEHEQEPACEPEPERRLSRKKRHSRSPRPIGRVSRVIAMTRRDDGM